MISFIQHLFNIGNNRHDKGVSTIKLVTTNYKCLWISICKTHTVAHIIHIIPHLSGKEGIRKVLSQLYLVAAPVMENPAWTWVRQTWHHIWVTQWCHHDNGDLDNGTWTDSHFWVTRWCHRPRHYIWVTNWHHH